MAIGPQGFIMEVSTKERKSRAGQKGKRGRLAVEEWQVRARYILRHLDDPIALQRSPLCRLVALERLAKEKYPDGVVARGRTLHDLALECLREIEAELDGHSGAARFKEFIALTRGGLGVTKASRELGITPEHATRCLKRHLVELLTEKLSSKLR
jgi:hypothetical protein